MKTTTVQGSDASGDKQDVFQNGCVSWSLNLIRGVSIFLLTMKNARTSYVCQTCGFVSPRWVGKCPGCEGWNTFVEEVVPRVPRSRRPLTAGKRAGAPVAIGDVDAIPERRSSCGVPELDRVLGGGVVPGSVVLVGGDPGIGKSTLMLQMASALRRQTTLYITGEESVRQIKLRAERLSGDAPERLLLLAETNLAEFEGALALATPDLMIVDSIQTMYHPDLESVPGSVSQIRESTAFFIKLAKKKDIPVFLVGHVTKDGMIAGPKVIEHMVDTVLQFEGERQYAYRILRAIKNRFGSTNEIGIFEMGESGLREVANPSEVFLAERRYGASGSAVVASLEGSRPLLLEVQSLVAPTSYGVPQRIATGFDARRLQMLLAVLERRSGMHLGQYDVFVNVAGGVRIDEPAADLGMAVAIASSLRDVPVDSEAVAVGEVGLGGEIRRVHHIDKRMLEAEKLGFKRMVLPRGSTRMFRPGSTLAVVEVDTVDQAVEELVGTGVAPAGPGSKS